jgi:hypothetical protein
MDDLKMSAYEEDVLIIFESIFINSFNSSGRLSLKG